VYSVDWLGCGASERPKFTARTTAQAEDFCIDALEKWRAELGIESFVLVGHSLGGYLCGAYTLRHPSRVLHLVLVSPGGLPTYAAVDPTAATGGLVPSTPASPTPRVIPKWLWSAVSYGWEHDITPGMLIRGFGPFAPMIARGSTKRRFSRLVLAKPVDASTLYALGMYFYHNLGGDGSGEYVLRHVFAAGAKARDAMGERLLKAVNAGAVAMPITFTYGGSHDWMSASAGRHYSALFVKAGLRSTVHLVTPGGHHLYLESADQFNQTVLKELHQTFSGQAGRMPSTSTVDTERIAVLTPSQAEVVGAGSPAVRSSSSSNKVLDAVSTME
jgi:pimeloyl-ACP methyl ester carboxylesterase